MLTPTKAIERAIKQFGSELALAQAIRFTAPAIRRARRTGRPTAEMCVNIEIATRRRVLRTSLRPDLFCARVKLIDNSWNRRRNRNGRAA